jgi:hypothetical protein
MIPVDVLCMLLCGLALCVCCDRQPKRIDMSEFKFVESFNLLPVFSRRHPVTQLRFSQQSSFDSLCADG